MTYCTFCDNGGHNIRGCVSNGVPFALMKLRCKHWKSIKNNDLSIVFRWLSHQEVSTLRVICIHKYRIFPKTMSKTRLVAIVMHLEFCRIVEEEDAFWRCDLPEGFAISTFDCNNEREQALIIVNINTYQPPDENLRFKSNDDLVDILMGLISEYRQSVTTNRRTRYRARIKYVEIPLVGDAKECAICYDDSTNLARLGCQHEFCCGCIEMHIRATPIATVNCPLCRGEIESLSAAKEENESLISIL
jgi:hypothetical protein